MVEKKRKNVVGTVLGEVFLPKALRQGFVATTSELVSSARFSFGMAKRTLSPPAKLKLDPALPAQPAERFAYFAAKAGMDDRQRLDAMVIQMHQQTIYTLITAVLYATAAYETTQAIIGWSGLIHLLAQFYSWVIASAFGMLALYADIKAYQLETARSVSAAEFFSEIQMAGRTKAGSLAHKLHQALSRRVTAYGLVAMGTLGGAFGDTTFLFKGEGAIGGVALTVVLWLLGLAFGLLTARSALRIVDLDTSHPPAPRPTGTKRSNPPSSDVAKTARRLPLGAIFTGFGLAGLLAQKASAQIATGSSDALSGAIGLVKQLAGSTSSDLSAQWLSILFPTGVTGGSMASSDILPSMFATFNTLMLNYGAGMIMWQGVTAIVQVAHDGSLGSKNWHQIWSPIRVGAGAAFLYPVNGYCTAQLVAIQILAGGYLMANQLWTSYVNMSLNSTNLTTSVTALSAMPPSDILLPILRAETCQSYVLNYLQGMKDAGAAQANMGPLSGNWDVETQDSSQPWIDQASDAGDDYVYNFGVCGSVSIGQTNATGNAFTNVFVNSGVQSSDTAGENDATFDAAKKTAFEALMTTIWQNGGNTATAAATSGQGLPYQLMTLLSVPAFVAKANNDPSDVIATPTSITAAIANDKAAVNTYTSALQTATSGYADGNPLSSFASTLSTNAKSMGWASAGAFYLGISQLSMHISGLAQAGQPTYTPVETAGLNSNDIDGINKALSLPQEILTSSDVSAAITSTLNTTSGTSTAPSSSTAGSSANPTGVGSYLPAGDASSDNSSTFTEFVHNTLAPPFQALPNALITQFTVSASNPIASIIQEGNVFLVIGEGVMVTAFMMAHPVISFIGAVTSGNLTGAAASLGAGLLQPFIGWVIMLAEMLITAGVVESVILPMMVYVTWLYAILNVIAFAAEFILAAPLAAFQHMRFDGQDFVEQDQKPFYTLMFNGLLRPSLLLFGLFISNFVLCAILTVFNATFKLAIISVQGENFIGICQTMGLVALQVLIQYQVLTRSVSMIHRVPQMVATLMNAGVRDLSGEDEGRNLIVAAAGSIRGGTSKAAASALTPQKKDPKPNSDSDSDPKTKTTKPETNPTDGEG